MTLNSLTRRTMFLRDDNDRPALRTVPEVRWPPGSAWECVFTRLALGGAFLSAVASRFGAWHGTIGLDRFGGFLEYTAEVNAFMPAWAIPFLAWSATAAELSLGVALIAGFRTRATAYWSALLLVLFGTAMAVSLGPKSPLDYSVFSASAAALLLGRAHDAATTEGK